MSLFRLIFIQTLSLSFRKGGGAFGTLAFFVIVATLFTFALGPQVMGQYSGAVLCVALLLSFVTALPLMFERDHEDGTLEQLLLQPAALEVLMLAKITGQFVACIVPIVLVSPLLALSAGLSFDAMLPVLARLCLASVSVVAIGSVAAALTIGARRGGLLQALIMLPLYTPVLIFAAGSGQGGMLFLAGIACASLPLSCWVSAALVRASVD